MHFLKIYNGYWEITINKPSEFSPFLNPFTPSVDITMVWSAIVCCWLAWGSTLVCGDFKIPVLGESLVF